MNFDELLKSLHRDYLASLPQKMALIRDQLNKGDVNELRESFHKLKGTGRTYGLPEVSELAAAVEEICKDLPQEALAAADRALRLMQDIQVTRSAGQEFHIARDTRFIEIQKILQNGSPLR